MKKTICAALLAALFCVPAFAKSGMLYVYEVENGEGQYRYGYKDIKGNVVLDAVYPHVYTEEFDKIAFVIKDNKIAGINKKGETVIVPFVFDNGPDYIVEGLFRFVDNEKMGFADKNGKIAIPAEYDFISPFEGGRAEYTLGGKKEYFPPDGEHWTWTGGYETGFINKKGKRFKK